MRKVAFERCILGHGSGKEILKGHHEGDNEPIVEYILNQIDLNQPPQFDHILVGNKEFKELRKFNHIIYWTQSI